MFSHAVALTALLLAPLAAAWNVSPVGRTAAQQSAKRVDKAGKQRSLTLTLAGDEEYRLWSGGSGLRGANVWLKIRGGDYEVPPATGYLYPTYDLQDFQKLREWGANYVSFSCPGVYGVEAPHHYDERAMNALKDLITLAGRAGLYASVAFRTGPLSVEDRFHTSAPSALWRDDGAGEAARLKWAEMWERAASELQGLPNVVGYELMVEPDAPNPDDWNRLAADIVRKVRGKDRVTPVIVGGARAEGDGSSVDALEHVGTFDDPYVVYTVHQYRPNAYAQQEVFEDKFESLLSYPCPPPVTPMPREAERVVVGYKDCGGPGCKAMMQAAYKTVDAWREGRRRKTGALPTVAVTETGVMRWSPGADKFLRDQFKEINSRNFNYALWRWGPGTSRCTGDDAFDLRRGHDFKLHNVDESRGNKLKTVVTKDWEKNKIFAPGAGR